MNRLTQRFADLGKAGRKALICYVTAGDPDCSQTAAIMHALVAAGSDILELGVPFSDPTADGPAIQAACERALANGTSVADVLQVVRDFRQTDNDTPVVLMGYLNPIEKMGVESFVRTASEAGVDGVLTVDMPPEEAGHLAEQCRTVGLATVFLVAPTTAPQRMRDICEVADGFVYYVSLKGVTGAKTLDTTEVAQRVATLKQVTALPVGVGFGIRDENSAARLAQHADAIVIGSALVDLIAETAARPTLMLERLSQKVAAMRAAMDVAVSEQTG